MSLRRFSGKSQFSTRLAILLPARVGSTIPKMHEIPMSRHGFHRTHLFCSRSAPAERNENHENQPGAISGKNFINWDAKGMELKDG